LNGSTNTRTSSLTVFGVQSSIPAPVHQYLRLRSRRCVGWRPHASALIAYVVLALVFSWPLPLHLTTHVTGPPDGDTGVYIWNQWVFHREVLSHGTNPYFTDRIFSMTGRADLTLHNYTALADLLALPLLSSLGIVTTFNLIYLFMTVVSAYAMFLLARAISGAGIEAWLAGVIFAWSPMLVTRGAGHFSLVAAAPLPLFVLLLMRAHKRPRVGHAVGLGLVVAVAFAADVYYAVYCVMLGTAYIAWHVVCVERRSAPRRYRYVSSVLDVMILPAGVLVVGLVITHGWVFTLFGRTVSVRELYTPVLALTFLMMMHVARRYRAIRVPVDRSTLVKTAELAIVAGLVSALLLSPVLSGLWVRIAEGRFVSPPIYWRSSPAGVDLVAIAFPNPNHPIAPAAWRAWLSARFDGYLESVASVPLSAVIVIMVAWRRGWRAPGMWVAFGIGSTLLALGPFIHIAGVNTYVPGPWALLRYVPVIGLARNPARFAVLTMLALAVLLALALTYLRNTEARRPWLRWAVAAIVIAELLPLPRPLYSAAVPAIYDRIAADPHDVAVLQLPFGVRDGASSFGNYTARTQFFQTRHGKRLIGGVLSRVSERRVNRIRSHAMLDALMRLSEGQPLDPGRGAFLAAHAAQFLERAKVGYVVIDLARASPALVDFAIRTLNLDELESDGPFVLYRPAFPPAKSRSALVR
jgi:hypothetical protein